MLVKSFRVWGLGGLECLRVFRVLRFFRVEVSRFEGLGFLELDVCWVCFLGLGFLVFRIFRVEGS